MVKTSKDQMKRDEKKVVKELEQHANDSIERIAKRCGFSRQKVWRIIKRLEKNKTVWGYQAITDDEKLGVTTYFILTKRTNKPLTKEIVDIIVNRKLKQKLTKLNIQLVGCYLVHGTYDWIILVKAPGITQIKIFIDGLLQEFGGYLSEIQTEEVLFPLQKGNIENPHPEKLKDYFLV